MRIAVLQMTSGLDPKINADHVADAIAQAATGGAKMLFAPEMAGLLDRNRGRAERHVVSEDASLYLARVGAAAARAGIWVHAGSLPVMTAGDDSRWRNHSVVFAPDGRIAARYDKLHLFDVDLPDGEVWRESANYAPGTHPVAVRCPVGLLGLTICYDLRFAALFDAYGAAGCSAIAVPAAFTVPTGSAHWHILLRARAIEQGAFIIAAAQCGTAEDGRTTFGHSLVVGPWGRVILDMGTEPGLAFVDIDTHRCAEVRAQLPSIRHRQPIDKVTVV